MFERRYQSKVLPKKEAVQKKKRRTPENIVRTALITCGALACIALIVYVLCAKQLRVTTIAVQGTSVIDSGDVEKFSQQYIQGTYLRFFPRTGIILVPTNALARALQRAFPRLATVSVSRTGIHRITVSVTEHRSTYLWCKEDTCLFMDNHGVVFAEAPDFSGSAYPKLYGGTASDTAPFIPFDKKTITQISEIITTLRSNAIQPLTIHVISDHEMRVECMRAAHSFNMIFDPTVGITKPLADFLSAMSTFVRDRKVINYADLRFEGKIVYTFE